MPLILSLLFLFFVQVPVNSQEHSSTEDSAAIAYGNQQYGQAILLYKKLMEDGGVNPCSKIFFLENLSDCYWQTGNRMMAKESLRRTILQNCEPGIYVGNSLKSSMTEKLANLWFDEKQYDSALYYYKYSDRYNDSSHHLGQPYRSINVQYGKFLCYRSLDKFDSAFNCFTPFVFDSLYGDRGALLNKRYIQLVGDYYSFLLTRYSRDEIKRSFMTGYRKLKIVFILEKNTGGEDYVMDHRADFIFFGNTFDLNRYHASRFIVSSRKKLSKFFPDYSKRRYRQRLSSSYLYKLIMSTHP